MKKITLFCFLYLIIISGFAQQKLKLFFVQDLDIKGQDVFVRKNNIRTYQIIYENFFVTNNKVDEVKLKRQLTNKFPNKNDGGLCVLDWEGDAIKTFQNPNNKKKLNHYKDEFKKAIQIAKSFRPNVKFAFFHLMSLSYYGKIANFKKQNENIEDIIQMQDFMAPALYVYNPSKKYQKSNDNYMKNKLLQALEVGSKYNIPTYPFIWNRTVSKNRTAGNELIPTEYFSNAVKLISQTSYNGIRAKGVLWWHSESYSYRNKSKFSIANTEYRSVKDVDVYQLDLFQKYLNSIKNYID